MAKENKNRPESTNLFPISTSASQTAVAELIDKPLKTGNRQPIKDEIAKIEQYNPDLYRYILSLHVIFEDVFQIKGPDLFSSIGSTLYYRALREQAIIRRTRTPQNIPLDFIVEAFLSTNIDDIEGSKTIAELAFASQLSQFKVKEGNLYRAVSKVENRMLIKENGFSLVIANLDFILKAYTRQKPLTS